MKPQFLLELFDETASLYNRLRVLAEQVHGQGEGSAGRRSILRSLDLSGPQTVPQMARVRLVSRQHVQVLVNALIDDGLLELVKNPSHKRSSIVQLSKRGKQMVAAMHKTEEEWLEQLTLDVSKKDIQRTAETLRMVRTAVEKGLQ
jgi:DNA-binding MarR family transcriptional regulator